MRSDYVLLPMLFAFSCVLLLQSGCQEKTEEVVVDSKPSLTVPAEPVNEPAVEAGPEITFENLTCDLGEIGKDTIYSCEFNFKNTGGSLLKIKKVNTCCGFRAKFKPNKKEYQPGEQGSIIVSFNSRRSARKLRKYQYVLSNDEKTPRVKLTVKAEVVNKVDYEPKRIKLLLNTENADCPEITLTSIDDRKFAIRRFKSTADCIEADIDSSVQAKKFVLQPKVNMEIIQKVLKGHVNISLTHPDCRLVSIPYEALPRFKVDPPAVMIYKVEPEKPVTKEIWVMNNYNEDFEIESASSEKGFVKVLNRQKVDKSFKFELQIVPPPADDKMKLFMDTFVVNIEGGEKLEIRCRGFYSKK